MREEFLNVINGQANRLQRLIDNLLNLARIEAGVVQVSKNVTSLNELLNVNAAGETLAELMPIAVEPVAVSSNRTLSPWIFCRRTRSSRT